MLAWQLFQPIDMSLLKSNSSFFSLLCNHKNCEILQDLFFSNTKEIRTLNLQLFFKVVSRFSEMSLKLCSGKYRRKDDDFLLSWLLNQLLYVI